MGMTDKQFESYQAKMLKLLKLAFAEAPNAKLLGEIITDLEAELKKP